MRSALRDAVARLSAGQGLTPEGIDELERLLRMLLANGWDEDSTADLALSRILQGNQLTIDDVRADSIGKFGRDAPETSRKAAIAVYPRTGSQRHRILLLLLVEGPMTCDRAEDLLGLPHQSVSARWNELWHDFGFIEPTGSARRTRAGAEAAVFRLTTNAVDAIHEHGDYRTA
jgi:hypothetical protein